MKTNWLDYTLLTLVIVGAVNWGLIGFFRFDLVAFLFGDLSWLSRIIYALVGIGGLYAISFLAVSTVGKCKKYRKKGAAHMAAPLIFLQGNDNFCFCTLWQL